MRNHVHIPNESGQYVSAQSYEDSILMTINSFPMHASTLIPMAQAVEFAELILSIAKPVADMQNDMLIDAINERKAT